MDRIKIGCANKGAGTTPVFSAYEGEYFLQNGLDAELLYFEGHANSLPALISGSVDFTNSVSPELISHNIKKLGDAVIIASAISRSAQQVASRPGLFQRHDLKGKRWGVLCRGDADECSIAMAFERWGWDITKDAEIVAVGSGSNRLKLLLDDTKVDAAIMHAPEIFQAMRSGWNYSEDLSRLDVAFQNSCAATTKRFLKVFPDIALRYTKAYCQGVYRFRTDPKFGIHVLNKYCDENDQNIIEKTYILFSRLMGGMMFPSLEGVRTACDILFKLAVVPLLPKPEEFVDFYPVSELEKQGFFESMMKIR
jgi:ABC-type nitrate/sulfonate/bicarbonate transport system substrate-binding protein